MQEVNRQVVFTFSGSCYFLTCSRVAGNKQRIIMSFLQSIQNKDNFYRLIFLASNIKFCTRSVAAVARDCILDTDNRGEFLKPLLSQFCHRLCHIKYVQEGGKMVRMIMIITQKKIIINVSRGEAVMARV